MRLFPWQQRAAKAIAATLLLSASLPAFCDPLGSPTGLWRTVDDRTGADRSIMRLEIQEQVINGRIVKSLDPRDAPDALCEKCPGERRDKPIIGMVILTGLKPSDERRVWSGGQILDPDTGSTYRATIKLSEDGRQLEVRGFVGLAFFGRSQVWFRVE